MAAGDNRGVIVHANLKGSQVHEPKNVETADENTVYFADGDGSGSWEPITVDKLSLLKQTVSRREQVEVNVPSEFSLVGLLNELTGVIYDATTFTATNKNTKEIAYKLNVALASLDSLNKNVKALREELSELQDRLANNTFIEVV